VTARRIRSGLRATLLAAAWLPALAGCIRVAPETDYQRTAQLIAERTGSREVYDPASEELVDQKITALLADGLTVDEAVQIALMNNRGLQALFFKVGASRADLVQSQLLSNPSMGFSVRFPEGGGRSNLVLNFGQELVDLWQIPVRKQIAAAELEQVVLGAADRAVDIAAEVRTRYHQLAAAQQAVGIARENVVLVERSLKLARDRYSAGEAGLLDVNLVRATLVEVRVSLINLEREAQVARAALGRVMGLSRAEAALHLHGPWPSQLSRLASEDLLLREALTRRPDAQVAFQRVKAARADLERQYLSIFSSVMMGAELERMERRALPGRKIAAETARASIANGALTAPDIESRGQRNLARRQIIDSLIGPTFQITLPIWDQNQAQIAKSAYGVQQRMRELEDLLDEIARQVQASYATARTADELHRFFEEQALPQARENIAAALKAYEAGEQGILAVIDAQRFLINQRLAAVNVVRDYAVALAELERAVGGRLPLPPTTQPSASQAAESGKAAESYSESGNAAAAARQ